MDKVGQYLIDIGSTDQLSNRHAHFLCVISSQNVAEVSGRNYNIQRISPVEFSLLCQSCIGRYIVNNLRNQTTPVDGVGTGEAHATFLQSICYCFAGENLLHTALTVIEVALYSANRNIAAFLGYHLAFLHSTNAFFRIEDHDLCTRNIFKAFQCSLSSIARSCNQNHNFLIQVQFLYSSCQEIRENLQGHILKCTGRAMPQFQHIGAFKQMCNFCNVLCFKILGIIGTFGAIAQLNLCKIRQILGEYKCSTLCISHVCHCLHFIHCNGRNGLRYKQTAFF